MKHIVAASLLFAGILGAQETATDQKEREATLADVVQALERIEGQIAIPLEGEAEVGYGFFIEPIIPVRLLLGRSKIQDYFNQGGSYEAVPSALYPFVNGGGVSMRLVFAEMLNIGFKYYGFGFSQLGFLRHVISPDGPNATHDENTDGWDDFYSYAGYGVQVFSSFLTLSMGIEGTPLGFYAGVHAGLGWENIGFTRSSRTTNVLANALGIQLGDLDWKRSLFVPGAKVGMEVGDSVKLALEAGFDYHIPMGDWEPAAGMHRTDIKPPSDVNTFNVWFVLGPRFNY